MSVRKIFAILLLIFFAIFLIMKMPIAKIPHAVTGKYNVSVFDKDGNSWACDEQKIPIEVLLSMKTDMLVGIADEKDSIQFQKKGQIVRIYKNGITIEKIGTPRISWVLSGNPLETTLRKIHNSCQKVKTI